MGAEEGGLQTCPSGDKQESSSNSVNVLSRAREMPSAAVTVPVWGIWRVRGTGGSCLSSVRGGDLLLSSLAAGTCRMPWFLGGLCWGASFLGGVCLVMKPVRGGS